MLEVLGIIAGVPLAVFAFTLFTVFLAHRMGNG